MARKKQPKYNVGDIVVITLYGTVGKNHKYEDFRWSLRIRSK